VETVQNVITTEYGNTHVLKLFSTEPKMRGIRGSSAPFHNVFPPSELEGTPATIMKSGKTNTVSRSGSSEIVLWLPFNMEIWQESDALNIPEI
jgi:hypothetical protein